MLFPKENWEVSFNAHYSHVDNLVNQIAPDTSISVFRNIPVEVGTTALNFGNINAYGFTFRTRRLIILPQGKLNVYGSYAFSDGTQRDIPLVLNSKHNVKLGADYSYGKLMGSVRYLYRTETFSNVPIDNTQLKNQAFGVVNLSMGYTIKTVEKYQLDLRLLVNNLLDNRYYHAGAGQASNGLLRVAQDPVRYNIGFYFNYHNKNQN